ncbi:Protein NipSnap [Hypsibius exemplaris]|uniref:Protein NipSnap n=1 Tax=Hypsibius exemplaris TaxID=2072580 RepID=A0A1W0WGW8_HYPEX|nr:Protein NipSnap [Hypsibius exemplaris]
MHCLQRNLCNSSLRDLRVHVRPFASGAGGKDAGVQGGKSKPAEQQEQSAPSSSGAARAGGGGGWISKLLQGQARTIETGKESHSRKLALKGVIYEMQTHNVKADQRSEYLKLYGDLVQQSGSNSKKIPASLVGSWMVETGGDQDQAIHIWKHSDGYVSFGKTSDALRNDQDLVRHGQALAKTLRSRQNQAMLSFSFWGDPEPSAQRRIYELRTYTLKPGTLIEWGNHWARAIHLRKSREDGVGGFFTQIGPLYIVHHIWAYADLEARKDARDAAWSSPGWDDCVANTVPLIREMNSRILVANSFSPLK